METAQTVRLTLLSSAGGAFDGRITGPGPCRRRLELLLDQPLPVGSPFQLESKSALYLGEVVACRRDGARFRALLALEQTIPDTAGLARLASKLLEWR